MAMTEFTLVFIGTLATLASVGMFAPMDGFTEIVLPFVAALLWGVVAFGAFEVIPLADESGATVEIMPLVWMAAGFAALSTLLGIYAVLTVTAEEATPDDRGIDL